MVNTYAIIVVNNDTPLVCTPEIFNTSKVHFSKRGYSFEYLDDDGESVTVSYSDQDCLDAAIDFAKTYALKYHKHTIWCVDGENMHIIGAFHVKIEQLL